MQKADLLHNTAIGFFLGRHTRSSYEKSLLVL